MYFFLKKNNTKNESYSYPIVVGGCERSIFTHITMQHHHLSLVQIPEKDCLGQWPLNTKLSTKTGGGIAVGGPPKNCGKLRKKCGNCGKIAVFLKEIAVGT